MVQLKEIDKDNYMQCLKLKVKQDQNSFVASNAVSLAQSKYHEDSFPLAIYSDDVMVGFLMHCIDADDNNHWIWRLMIDEGHQGKGYGKEAMKQVMENIKKDKTRNKILLSFEPENKNAERLYTSLGFIATGEINEGEAVMQYDY